MLKGRFLCVIAAFAASCAGHSDSPESPTQPTSSTSALANISVEPRAVNGGAPSTVTITLGAPASAPTAIALTSDTPAVAIPSSITVAAGSSTASVRVSTSPVSRDTTAIITASLGERAMRYTLNLWSIQPTSFWYDATSTDVVGYNAVGRYTGDTASFRATCDASAVYVVLSQPPSTRWELALEAPRGTPLRPGTYDVLPGFSDPSRPNLRIQGSSYICSIAKAQFVVETYEHGTMGDIGRFVATIEQQQCLGVGVFRAEIRLTNPPGFPGPTANCTP
jgi:hypothetical protein